MNLGERQRVKINGVKVTVPYRMAGGQVTVRREDETLRVDTQIGIKVCNWPLPIMWACKVKLA